MAESWIDIIPSIPLDIGVVLPDGSVVAYATKDGHGLAGFVKVSPFGIKSWQPSHGKPGLQHPQGFGYALRWFDQNSNEAAEDFYSTHDLTLGGRYLRDETDDGDRLALALALAEVMS